MMAVQDPTSSPETLRLNFCKTFIKVSEKEFRALTLKDSYKNLKASENLVRAFCSGLGLITLNPVIGKMAAGAVKVLIRKVDEIRRERRKKVAEDKVGEDIENTREFQSAFRKLMLRSAIEIWQSYEQQFLSIQQGSETMRIKRTSSLFGSLRSQRGSQRENVVTGTTTTALRKSGEDNNNQSKNPQRSSSRKKGPTQSLEKLASYAAVRCIQYLVEEKRVDYPHKFVLTPQFWDIAKSKWKKFFFGDRIPLLWSDTFEDKSTVEFFKDPIALVPISGSDDDDEAPDNSTVTGWVIDKRAHKNLKGSSKVKKKNSKEDTLTLSSSSNCVLQFRRNFDFEQKSKISLQKKGSEKFVKVNFEGNVSPEIFNKNYFTWTEKSGDVDKVYNTLLEDPHFSKIDSSNLGLTGVLNKLTKVSESMTEFKKDLEILKLSVEKIMAEQTVVKMVVLDIQSEQSKISENVNEIKILELETKVKVKEMSEEQSEIRVKVEEIHQEIVKSKEQRRSRGQSISQFSGPVTTFSMTEKPPTWFTGREDTLDDIFRVVCGIDDSTNILNRIVVISGLGGIGKSSIVKMYALKFRTNHQNIAWLNAETEESLKNSFFLLADHFKICGHILSKQSPGTVTGSVSILTPNDISTLVKEVYRHFSVHVKEGLFIFDNANQMRSAHGEFGIQDFLPVDTALEYYPIFLITSRNKNWTMIPRKIHLACLSTEETLSFFSNSLHLPELICLNKEKKEGKEENPDYLTLVKSIENLGLLLDGYPLAMNLAAASILENLELLGFQEFDEEEKSGDFYFSVSAEIENYMTQFHHNGLKWVTYEGEGGVVSRYDKIMATVWEGTMNKLKREFRADDPLHEIATDLLNLIAYLPTDLITVEFCHFIYNGIRIKEEIFPQQVVQGQRGLVRKAFGVLEKYSMVSLIGGEESQMHFPYYLKLSGCTSVRVHRLVQKWTRESLKQNGQARDLLRLAKYLQWNGLRFEYWDCARDHLRELKWPQGSYRDSIFVHYFGIYPQGGSPWKEVWDFFELNPGLKEEDKEFWEICQLGLQYYDRMGQDDVKVKVHDEDVNVEVEKILNRTLELTLKYPKNQLLYQMSTDILFHVPYDTLVIPEREEKLRDWIRGHFNFITEESSNPILSPSMSPIVPPSSFHKDMKGQAPLTFLSLSGRLLPAEELVGKISVATEFRLRNDGHLHCLTFLSSALLRIRSWPKDTWRLSTEDPPSPSMNYEIASKLIKIFLENNGMAMLTRSLVEFQEIFRRGHFIEIRHMVIFGLIQNFGYFDEIATMLTTSKEFVSVLTSCFQAATQQPDKTVNDRRAHIGIVFSWLALLVKKDRVKSVSAVYLSIIEENLKQFVGKLQEYQQKSMALDMDEFSEHCCPVYFNEIRRGRFSRSRRGVVKLFIESREEDEEEIDRIKEPLKSDAMNDGFLFCGKKLLEILETKCSCMTD